MTTAAPGPLAAPGAASVGRVALFVPCYVDQFFPAVARATLETLERYGETVIRA